MLCVRARRCKSSRVDINIALDVTHSNEVSQNKLPKTLNGSVYFNVDGNKLTITINKRYFILFYSKISLSRAPKSAYRQQNPPNTQSIQFSFPQHDRNSCEQDSAGASVFRL